MTGEHVTLTHSEAINELATALAKAQGSMRGALKDADNPFFKSRYADLASVWEACRKPLTEWGLSVIQSPAADGNTVRLETLLMHTSGQWVRGIATATAKEDSPQAIGSAITYLRRYALQSFAGVAPEDDDGEAAEGRKAGAKAVSKPAAKPAGFDDWLLDISATAENGTKALREAWSKSRADYRDYTSKHLNQKWEDLKAKAAQSEQVPA